MLVSVMKTKKKIHKARKSHFAKKALGQNFLNNTQIRENILEEAGDISDKNILEIGPGLGFLTSSLLATKTNLTAIEMDDRAVRIFGTRIWA